MAMVKGIVDKIKKFFLGVSYTRVSTFGQAFDENGMRRDDGSIEAQKSRCESYIKFLWQKTGLAYKIIKHICDEGLSGKNTNRDGWRELWSLIENRQITFVVAVELSRFARNVADFLALVAHAEKHGVKIFIIGLDLDTSTPIGRVVVTILCALAQFEREITGERTRENAMARLLKDGRINGSAEILGLVRDQNRKGHFLVDGDGIRIAESIMKLFLKFSSKQKVLEYAKEMGLTGKEGKAITIRQIEYVLKNAETRYRGIWYANPENREKDQGPLPPSQKFYTVNLPHGPLLDTKMLDEVVEKLRDTYAKKKRSGSEEYIYLLSHLLIYEDGSRFQGQCAKNRKYRYYHNRKNDFRVRCEQVDQIVLKRLKSYLRDDNSFSRLVECALKQRASALLQIDQDIDRKREELVDLATEDSLLTTELVNHLKSGGATANWLDDKVAVLRKKKEQKEAESQLLELRRETVMSHAGLDDFKKLVQDFIHSFDKLSGTQKRNLIEKIIKNVIIRPGNKLEIVMYQNPRGSRQTPVRERTLAKPSIESASVGEQTPEKENPAPLLAVAVAAQERSTGESKYGVTDGA